MPHKLHIPGEPPKSLRWSVHHAASHYGNGVLLYRNSSDILDGATFRLLRDRGGAWIQTDNQDQVRRALGVPEDESLGDARGS